MKYKLFRSPGNLDKAIRKHELVAVETGKNIDDVADALIRAVRDDLAEMPEYAHCETAAYAPEPVQEHRRVRRYQYEMMGVVYPQCALPGFVDSKNEEKTERNAGYLVVSHSGGGMLRQGTRKGIRRTPANRGMRAHRIVKSLDISEDVCHGLCP